jgi:hypothetical protein
MDCYDCELMKKCEECKEINYIGCADIRSIDFREFYLKMESKAKRCYIAHEVHKIKCYGCALEELCGRSN